METPDFDGSIFEDSKSGQRVYHVIRKEFGTLGLSYPDGSADVMFDEGGDLRITKSLLCPVKANTEVKQ